MKKKTKDLRTVGKRENQKQNNNKVYRHKNMVHAKGKTFFLRYEVVRVGLINKVTFDQKLEGDQYHVGI